LVWCYLPVTQLSNSAPKLPVLQSQTMTVCAIGLNITILLRASTRHAL